MTKSKRYYVGNETLPTAFSTEIMVRAFPSKDLKEIWETYKDARNGGNHSKDPTDSQKKIAEKVKLIGNASKVAREMKLAPSVVYSAIRKVAVYHFLQN